MQSPVGNTLECGNTGLPVYGEALYLRKIWRFREQRHRKEYAGGHQGSPQSTVGIVQRKLEVKPREPPCSDQSEKLIRHKERSQQASPKHGCDSALKRHPSACYPEKYGGHNRHDEIYRYCLKVLVDSFRRSVDEIGPGDSQRRTDNNSN